MKIKVFEINESEDTIYELENAKQLYENAQEELNQQEEICVNNEKEDCDAIIEDMTDQLDQYKKEYEEMVKNVKTETELDIHDDDSIIEIKNKIIKKSKLIKNINEMYLYSIVTINHGVSLDEFVNEKFNELSGDTSVVTISSLLKSNYVYNLKSYQKEYTFEEFKNIIVPNKQYIPLGIQIPNILPVKPDTSIKYSKTIREENNRLFNEYYSDPLIYVVYFNDEFNDVSSIYFPSKNNIIEDINYDTKNNYMNFIKENELNSDNYIVNNELFSSLNFSFYNSVLVNSYVPLEIIFRDVHVSENIPIIKFNPGREKDNIYRLYSNKQTYNHKKIPHSSLSTINKMPKGKYENQNQSYISFYMKDESIIIISIYEDATIYVDFENKKMKSLNVIKEYISDKCNYLLNLIHNIPSFPKDVKILKFNGFDLYSDVYNTDYEYELDLKINVKKLFNFVKKNKKLYPFECIHIDNSKIVFEYFKINPIHNKCIVELVNQRKIKVKIYKVNNVNYINNINKYLLSMLDIFNNEKKLKSYTGLLTNYLKEFEDKEYLYNQELEKQEIKEREERLQKEKEFEKKMEEQKQIDEKQIQGIEEIIDDGSEKEETKEIEKESDDDSDGEDYFNMLGGGGKKGKSHSEHGFHKKRIEDYDGEILNKNNHFEKSGKSYTSTCGQVERKQPIIINEQQKQNIDKNHKGSYKMALKYHSNPKNPMYYICPQYWCEDQEISLTPNQVTVSKYDDKNIPQEVTSKLCFNKDDPDVPGKIHINNNYKWYDKSTNEFKGLYPGFSKGKNQDKSCIPCCQAKLHNHDPPSVCDLKGEFVTSDSTKKTHDEDEMKKQKEKTNDISKGKKEEKKEVKKEKKEVKKKDEYKKSYDFKPPLQLDSYAYLSKNVLNILNSKPFDDKKNVGFLRRGTLNTNNKQSFLSCILLIYSLNFKEEENHFSNTFSNDSKMIKYLTKIIGDVDNFVSTLTGDLKNQYYNPKLKVKLDKYKKSSFYDKSKSFEKLVNEWESYVEYIENNVSDHTVLWDFVSSPNKNLFEKGCNIIILEEHENSTRMICPYNKQKSRNNLRFVENLPSIILYKKDVNDIPYYEPIVYFSNRESQYSMYYYSNKEPNLKKFLIQTKIIFNDDKYCGMIPPSKYYDGSLVYEFLSNNTKKIETLYQVLDVNFKNVGFIIKYQSKAIYLPNYASEIVDDVPHIKIHDKKFEKFIMEYETTKDMLNSLYNFKTKKYAGGFLKCKPYAKIVTKDINNEDTITGIMIDSEDENNELFVRTNPHYLIEDELIIKTNLTTFTDTKIIDPIDVDIKVMNEKFIEPINNNINIKTLNKFDRIKYQDMFYSLYKYFLQNLILHSKHKTEFLEIKGVIDDKNDYDDNLQTIQSILQKISKDVINFVDDYKTIKLEKLYTTQNDDVLELPKYNLYNGENNEMIFYKKYADEILRYSDLKLFYHVPDIFFTSSVLSYSINDDEIMLFESFLNEYYKYFENARIKNNVLNSSYDTSYPIYDTPNLITSFDLNKSLPKTEKLINIVK